jgi:hypothetical protein
MNTAFPRDERRAQIAGGFDCGNSIYRNLFRGHWTRSIRHGKPFSRQIALISAALLAGHSREGCRAAADG